jgi:hypothetical protein
MSEPNAAWIPFSLPEAIASTDGEKYFLALKEDAEPATNPTKFLEWATNGFPEGENLSDMLYWDPSAREGKGGWVVLPAFQETFEEGEFIPPKDRVLTLKEGILSWLESFTIPEGENVGDLIYWDGEKWDLISAPSTQGILYWDGFSWSYIIPPNGDQLNVLTARLGVVSWTPTQDCE